MKTVFIADKEMICRSFPDCLVDIKEKRFKDSLVVYSYKDPVYSFDELKSIVNSYRQVWENTIYQDTESNLEDYSNLLEEFNHLGSVINTSKSIGVSGLMISPSSKYQGLSVFIDDFDGEVIFWEDDITRDSHILGLGKNKNFFTVNNYL